MFHHKILEFPSIGYTIFYMVFVLMIADLKKCLY